MATELRPFIVAEISKNWIDGKGVVDDMPIAVLFERVIETNTRRGYRLHSFQLHRLMTTQATAEVDEFAQQSMMAPTGTNDGDEAPF
jgi:hypothetical protein